MSTCPDGNLTSALGELTITEEAIGTFRALLGALTGRVRTHAYRDGGLICEDRTSPARPRVWRIAADGALLPERSYNFARGGFISVPLPAEVGGR